MYFKYRAVEANTLTIREVKHLRVIEQEDGAVLVPWDAAHVCEVIDAAINRMAFVHEEKDTNMRGEASRAIAYVEKYSDSVPAYTLPVYKQMEFSMPAHDALKWYATREEAEAELELIAQALSRGDVLYDLAAS